MKHVKKISPKQIEIEKEFIIQQLSMNMQCFSYKELEKIALQEIMFLYPNNEK